MDPGLRRDDEGGGDEVMTKRKRTALTFALPNAMGAIMYQTLRPLLFSLDAERAHALTLKALAARGKLPVAAPTSNPRLATQIGTQLGFIESTAAGRRGFEFALWTQRAFPNDVRHHHWP